MERRRHFRMSSFPPHRNHAIVMGASVAGLLAARALSPHFECVTVIDKDYPPDEPQPRDGAPQGRHIHVLLCGGVRAIDRLFPDRLPELVRSGALPFDYASSQFHILGHWMPRIRSELYTLAQSRPFLEEHLRSWVTD